MHLRMGGKASRDNNGISGLLVLVPHLQRRSAETTVVLEYYELKMLSVDTDNLLLHR